MIGNFTTLSGILNSSLLDSTTSLTKVLYNLSFSIEEGKFLIQCSFVDSLYPYHIATTVLVENPTAQESRIASPGRPLLFTYASSKLVVPVLTA